MEVFDCIRSRRTVRKFEKKQVPWEYVSLLIDAGRMAPSAGNLQNFKFIVALDEGKRSALAEACVKQFWMAEAPVIIVICGEPETAKRFYGDKGELYTIQNCAAAAENMLLEAHNVGLGAAWVSAFDPVTVRRIFSIPDDVVPYVCIPVGYVREEEEEPAKFPVEHVTYFNGWRGKIRSFPSFFSYYKAGLKESLDKSSEKIKEKSEQAVQKAKDVAQKIKDKFKKKKDYNYY